MESEDEGWPAAEARRRALLDFGGIDLAKEECRNIFIRTWLERVGQDLHYGARMLFRVRVSPSSPLRATWTSRHQDIRHGML